MTFTMYDAVDATQVPEHSAIAYYATSHWANLGASEARQPTALMPILDSRGVVPPFHDLVGWQHGVEIDIESTLWVPSDAVPFAEKAKAAGVEAHWYVSLSQVPLVAITNSKGELLGKVRATDLRAAEHGHDPERYQALATAEAKMTCHELAAKSKLPELVDALASAGLARSDVKLRTAHWTYIPHICTGIGGTRWGTINADATQFSDHGYGATAGRSLDVSLCDSAFFGGVTPPPPPPPPPPEQKQPTGQARSLLIVDYDKPVGHRISVTPLKGTWRQGSEQGLELMQVGFWKDGHWRSAGIPNNVPPLGG